MQIMLGFIAAGIGVSLLPDHVKRLRKPGIVFRPPSSAKVELAIAWCRDDASPILREFLEIVRRCAQIRQCVHRCFENLCFRMK